MVRIIAALLLVAITGCVSHNVSTSDTAGILTFPSLTPQSLGRNLSRSQLVTGEHNGKTYRARYEIDITDDRLVVVGLTPLGITLFTLVQTNREISVETHIDKLATIDPRYTLFDIYVTFWPLDVLRTALRQKGMTIVEDDDLHRRTIRGADDKIIATVTRAQSGTRRGEIAIEHFDLPYRLRITPAGASAN